MRKPGSVGSLEEFGRQRLSKSFFMRDFLYSEIANFYGLVNIPDKPDLALQVGRHLCEELLEPLQDRFGRISVRSAYRSCAVNQKGNDHDHGCARNEANYAAHIWDRPDAKNRIGATACVVVNAFVPYYERSGHWEALAWWIHDHLPHHSGLEFFPKLAAFNIAWRTEPDPSIRSYIPPRSGWLTKPGGENFAGLHEAEYRDFLASLSA